MQRTTTTTTTTTTTIPSTKRRTKTTAKAAPIPWWAVVDPDGRLGDHFVRPTASHAAFIARGVRRRTEEVARSMLEVPQV